jgi:hypothetical protein
MKRVTLRIATLFCVRLLLLNIAFASCVAPENLEVWEAKVERCEELDIDDILPSIEVSDYFEAYENKTPKEIAKIIIENSGGILLTLRPIRRRFLDYWSFGARERKIVWLSEWQTAKDQPPERFLVTKNKGCAELKKGDVHQVAILYSCCDAIPARAADCILNVSYVEILSGSN